jgi:hypothetical protein
MNAKMRFGLVFFLFLLVPFVFAAPSENSNQGGDIVLSTVILLPSILGLFFLVGSATMGDDHHVLKIALFMLSIIGFFLSSWLGMVAVVEMYSLFDAFQGAIATVTFIVAVIWFVLLSYFVFYAVFKTKDFFQKKREQEQSLEY